MAFKERSRLQKIGHLGMISESNNKSPARMQGTLFGINPPSPRHKTQQTR